MRSDEQQGGRFSRRSILAGSGAILASGAAGAVLGAYPRAVPAAAEADKPPPLPWEWATLDPL